MVAHRADAEARTSAAGAGAGTQYDEDGVRSRRVTDSHGVSFGEAPVQGMGNLGQHARRGAHVSGEGAHLNQGAHVSGEGTRLLLCICCCSHALEHMRHACPETHTQLPSPHATGEGPAMSQISKSRSPEPRMPAKAMAHDLNDADGGGIAQLLAALQVRAALA